MKKNNPFISIIMNCHNGETFLNKSLKSIISQNFKNWELIFWNNMSEDKSREIFISYKEKRFRYFESKKFLNLYQARNLAIKKAKGKYICFLDTDDWWMKNKLKSQINILKRKKNINFIFSNCYTFSQNLKKKTLHFRSSIPSGKITQDLLNNYKIAILTVMIKKSLFKNKKFNSNFNIIGDFDYFINLSLKENFYCINSPLAFYRFHSNNFSNKTDIYLKELRNWLKQNNYKFEKKGLKLTSIKILYYKLFIKNILKKIGRVVQW